MNFIEFFEDLMDGGKQMIDLAEVSKDTIDRAKKADPLVAKIWLAFVVNEVCKAQNINVKDFTDYVNGRYKDVYKMSEQTFKKTEDDGADKECLNDPLLMFRLAW